MRREKRKRRRREREGEREKGKDGGTEEGREREAKSTVGSNVTAVCRARGKPEQSGRMHHKLRRYLTNALYTRNQQ